MPHQIRRREFLRHAIRATLSFSVVPSVAGAEWNWTRIQASKGASWETLRADLEKQIPALMKEARLPGLGIAIIKDGAVYWLRGFGVRNAATKEPVDNDTVFEAASMSKPVFAYAVMRLCDKGVMNLDTPLTKYTSERFLIGDPRLDLITARHVLSHTSGFQNWRSQKEPLKIHFTPGERHRYSGEGYSYLQSVVTHLTGRVNRQVCAKYEDGLDVCATDIDAYMKANVLRPLAMRSSGYVWDDVDERRAARGHDAQGRPFERSKGRPTDVARYASAGALLTTPTEYATFLLEVLDPKQPDAFRLKKESRDEMLRPHVKVGDSPPSSWALGWQLFHDGERTFIAHGGDNKGFHAFAVGAPDTKSGYVIMTNGDGGVDVLRKVMEKINAQLAP
jgi:CubicO group peptidase (beta-lactamase class C family)